jgi:hypothetical protein
MLAVWHQRQLGLSAMLQQFTRHALESRWRMAVATIAAVVAGPVGLAGLLALGLLDLGRKAPYSGASRPVCSTTRPRMHSAASANQVAA